MTVWWHPDASGSSPAVWCIPAPECRWSSWSVPTACPTGEPSAGAYLSHLGSYSLFHLPASNQRQIKINPTLIKHAFILFLYNLLIKQYLCQNICKTICNPFYIFFYLCFYFTEELEGIYVCWWFWKSKSYEHNLQMFCNVWLILYNKQEKDVIDILA